MVVVVSFSNIRRSLPKCYSAITGRIFLSILSSNMYVWYDFYGLIVWIRFFVVVKES